MIAVAFLVEAALLFGSAWSGLLASMPMLVTLLGMVTLVRLAHPERAYGEIMETLLGIVMLVRPVRKQNAPSPMLVTLSGIATLVRLVSRMSHAPANA